MKEQLNDFLMLLLNDARNFVFILSVVLIMFILRSMLKSHFKQTYIEPIWKVPSESFKSFRVSIVGKQKTLHFTVHGHKKIGDFMVENKTNTAIIQPVVYYASEQRSDGLYFHAFFDREHNMVEHCFTSQPISSSQTIIHIHEPINNNNNRHEPRIEHPRIERKD